MNGYLLGKFARQWCKDKMKNKKGEIDIIIWIVLVAIILFFGSIVYTILQESKTMDKLDTCISKNYNGIEYDYNKIINCCNKLDYFRDAYCLERFKPGYKENENP